MADVIVRLRRLHEKQQMIRDSPAKRKCIRAGRRGGKTTLAADIAVDKFVDGHRILYAVPTQEQVDRFWFEVKRALQQPLSAGIFVKNETRHTIELPGTEQRIRAKTAWDADSLRGDYADILILDEFQLMDPAAWNDVGAPMLLDNDGDAIFIHTPRRGKKGDHARRLFREAEADTSGRWAVFHFTSHDSPYLNRRALGEITRDMTRLSYMAEIMAEEIEDDPAALWKRETLEANRGTSHPDLVRVIVGVDPPGSEEGAECGIVAAGGAWVAKEWHIYILADDSLHGSPARWGQQAVATYNRVKADRMVGEANFGGDMVEHTIRTVEGGDRVAFRLMHASRGKQVRAEPMAALYERGLVHHVGTFGELEDQMCQTVFGVGPSPDRLDAAVWALTELMETSISPSLAGIEPPDTVDPWVKFR